LHTSGGFSRIEIRRIHKLVADHAEELKEAWDAYFNG
jgi:flagellar motor switch protein FliM